MKTPFLSCIALLRGTSDLAGQSRIILAKSFLGLLAPSRSAPAAALTDMLITGVATSQNTEVLRGSLC